MVLHILRWYFLTALLFKYISYNKRSRKCKNMNIYSLGRQTSHNSKENSEKQQMKKITFIFLWCLHIQQNKICNHWWAHVEVLSNNYFLNINELTGRQNHSSFYRCNCFRVHFPSATKHFERNKIALVWTLINFWPDRRKWRTTILLAIYSQPIELQHCTIYH